MAGRGGRPKKGEEAQETRQIRVFNDVAEMLADLALVHPRSTAQILDPLIRAEFLGMVSRTFNFQGSYPYSYRDVAPRSWYAAYAGIASP